MTRLPMHTLSMSRNERRCTVQLETPCLSLLYTGWKACTGSGIPAMQPGAV